MKSKFIAVAFLLIVLIVAGCQRMNGNTARNEDNSNQPNDNVTESTDQPINNEAKNIDQPTNDETDNADHSLQPDDTTKNNNYYDVNEVKIGDSVGGMKIIEFDYNGEPLDSEMIYYYVHFEGEFELDCILKVIEEEDYYISSKRNISDCLPFSSLEATIEDNKADKLHVGFYIINEEDFINEVKKNISNFKKGDIVGLKAIFSNYSLFIGGYNFEHWARFEKLIQIN